MTLRVVVLIHDYFPQIGGAQTLLTDLSTIAKGTWSGYNNPYSPVPRHLTF